MRIPIERYTLENGLRVVLSEDHTTPVVAVNLWYNVGSRNELPGKTGLAHLFEHMMFQGSQNVGEPGHIALVERAGGNLNGSTWLDRTNYYDTVPSDQLELALWLESDRMGFFVPALTQEKFDTQREVVKNERRQRVEHAPYGDWDARIQAMVYPEDHPYHHPVIGSMADLDAASLDDVREFFETYYVPNNAVLTLCGDFDPAEARRLIEAYFGPFPRGPEIPPLPGRPVPEPLRIGREVRAEVEDPKVPLARVYLAWRIPPYGEPEYYAADLLAELLAGGKSTRLYRTTVRERRLARGIGAFTFPVVTGASAFLVRGNIPAGGDARALEAAVLDEIERIATQGPDAAEMERAATGLEARHLLDLQKPSERADTLSMLTTYFDDPGRINTELDRYRAVTADDVRRLAREYLGAGDRVALTYLQPALQEAA
jgi:zinc protease